MLDLSYNQLTGTIPAKIWSLPRLYYLILNDNNITGPLPNAGGEQISFLSVHHTLIQDDAFDAAVCRGNANNRASVETGGPGIIVSTDCDAGCSAECCGDCCRPEDEDSCSADIIAGYTDGLDFVPAPLAIDPSILEESHMTNGFDMDSSQLDP
jgi:hypothetical protein